MEKETFKNNISKYLKKETSAAFTDKVMQSVYANVNEADLKFILKRSLIHKAPANFTSAVLEQITQESAISDYTPVISRKAWYIFGAILVLILALSFSQPESNAQSKYVISTLDFINTKVNVFIHFLNTNTFLMMLIVSISSLIFLDTIFKSGKHSLKNI